MFFWDSSAIVALLLYEKETERIRSFLEQSEELSAYISVITPLEIASAIVRKIQDGAITLKQADLARLIISEFRKEVYLVFADQNVLDIALHLQKIYSLKVADAIQLASARVGTENPSVVNFLSLDEKLNNAARLEGFNAPF